MTVHGRQGVPTLHFRLANERPVGVLEASVAVYLVYDETTSEGQRMRRFEQLELERESTPMFTNSFTVMHRLDEPSPLHGSGRRTSTSG
jgi:inward rectifier potassium channel